jgi:hypothetical protein
MNKENDGPTFLVFKRKKMTIEVPDDFPEDQIPNFIHENEFDAWCHSKGFKSLTLTNEKALDKVIKIEDKPKLADQTENSTGDINSLVLFLKHMEAQQHLLNLSGGFVRKLFAIYPDELLEITSKGILPKEAFQMIKEFFIKRFPQVKVKDFLQKRITEKIINDASEAFIAFLKKEKVSLSHIHFFSLDFANPSTFHEQEDWDALATPPFTLKKLELLVAMCDISFEDRNRTSVIENLRKLILTKQDKKLKLILDLDLIPKEIFTYLLANDQSIKRSYRILLSNYAR